MTNNENLSEIVQSLALSVTEIKNLEHNNHNRIVEMLERLDRENIRRSRDEARLDRILSEIRELNADVKELATENNRILRYLENLTNQSN